ncbi:MAG TPA: tetratricopeptide repeat protein [Allosphingosinicella sp.]
MMLAPALAFALVVGQSPPAVIPPAGPGAETGLTAAQVFALAEEMRREGRLDESEELLRALLKDPELDVRVEARFRLGKWRMERGFPEEAARHFARIIEDRPKAAPVRLEYARALAAMGQESSALRQIQRMQAAALPRSVRLAADRIGSALQTARAWGGSVELGLAPDSNFSQGTGSRQIELFGLPFELDEEARARGGVGITFAGSLYRRERLSPTADLLAVGAAEGAVYDLDRGNHAALSLSVGPEFGRRLRPSVSLARRWYGGRTHSSSFGGAFSLRRPLGRTALVDTAISVQRVKVHRNAEQSATFASASLSVEKALTPTLHARASLFGSRNSAAAAPYSSISGGGDMLLAKDVGAWVLYGRLGYSLARGDAIFPLFGDRRSDRRLDMSTGISFRRIQIAGATPVLRITRSSNRSSLELFDFRRTRVDMALSRPF